MGKKIHKYIGKEYYFVLFDEMIAYPPIILMKFA